MIEEFTPQLDDSPEMCEAIETHAHRLFEHVQDRIAHHQAGCIEECRDQLGELLSMDGTEVLDLSLDDQLGLVEEHADDIGLQLDSVNINSLRFQIGALAGQVIHYLGEEKAADLLLDLEHFMNLHELDLGDLTTSNNLGHLPHRSERSEADGCTVYEYRGVDGLDIDVYEVNLGGIWALFFQKIVTMP